MSSSLCILSLSPPLSLLSQRITGNEFRLSAQRERRGDDQIMRRGRRKKEDGEMLW